MEIKINILDRTNSDNSWLENTSEDIDQHIFNLGENELKLRCDNNEIQIFCDDNFTPINENDIIRLKDISLCVQANQSNAEASTKVTAVTTPQLTAETTEEKAKNSKSDFYNSLIFNSETKNVRKNNPAPLNTSRFDTNEQGHLQNKGDKLEGTNFNLGMLALPTLNAKNYHPNQLQPWEQNALTALGFGSVSYDKLSPEAEHNLIENDKIDTDTPRIEDKKTSLFAKIFRRSGNNRRKNT